MADIYERIGAEFATGTGEDSSAGGWNPNGIGPADLLVSRVVEILQADSKLAGIFATPNGSDNFIERWDFFPYEDYSDLPKLYVYPTSAEAVVSPTNLMTDRTTIYLGIRFEWLTEHGRNLGLYTPGLSSLLTYLRSYLAENADPICATVSGAEFVVGHSMQLDAVSLVPERPNDGPWIATVEVAASWKQDIDLDTGRLEDQPAAA